MKIENDFEKEFLALGRTTPEKIATSWSKKILIIPATILVAATTSICVWLKLRLKEDTSSHTEDDSSLVTCSPPLSNGMTSTCVFSLKNQLYNITAKRITIVDTQSFLKVGRYLLYASYIIKSSIEKIQSASVDVKPDENQYLCHNYTKDTSNNEWLTPLIEGIKRAESFPFRIAAGFGISVYDDANSLGIGSFKTSFYSKEFTNTDSIISLLMQIYIQYASEIPAQFCKMDDMYYSYNDALYRVNPHQDYIYQYQNEAHSVCKLFTPQECVAGAINGTSLANTSTNYYYSTRLGVAWTISGENVFKFDNNSLCTDAIYKNPTCWQYFYNSFFYNTNCQKFNHYSTCLGNENQTTTLQNILDGVTNAVNHVVNASICITSKYICNSQALSQNIISLLHSLKGNVLKTNNSNNEMLYLFSSDDGTCAEKETAILNKYSTNTLFLCNYYNTLPNITDTNTERDSVSKFQVVTSFLTNLHIIKQNQQTGSLFEYFNTSKVSPQECMKLATSCSANTNFTAGSCIGYFLQEVAQKNGLIRDVSLEYTLN